jgi:hypothetical protein
LHERPGAPHITHISFLCLYKAISCTHIIHGPYWRDWQGAAAFDLEESASGVLGFLEKEKGTLGKGKQKGGQSYRHGRDETKRALAVARNTAAISHAGETVDAVESLPHKVKSKGPSHRMQTAFQRALVPIRERLQGRSHEYEHGQARPRPWTDVTDVDEQP